MSNTNWQELVNQAKNNDQSAITKLYELTNQNAYFVAISMMKNEDDTFDIMQNAYIKAFDKLDTLENPEKFQSWLNQIVSNECKMALRKHRDFVFSDFETEDGYDFGDMIENDNIEFNPDSNIEYEETKQAMEEILHKLPDEQRLVVLMFYFQELSIKEIAQILDCSENTVKSRLNYAKKKIKTEVEELEKKGHKLYGMAPLPLFLWFIRKMAKESSVPKALSSSITKALSTTAITASSGAVAGTVAKTGLTLAHKIIIGVVATAVAVTGTVAGVTKLKDVSSTPEETPTEMTNQSAEADAPVPITEEEITRLLYDSLEYYDTYLYGRGYASTEKIDMGNPIIEKEGYYIEECNKYESYDECMASLREYYSENAIQKIIKETNLTEHDGKCYMNIFEGVGDPGREIKSFDSIDKIDNTTYAINMTLNNYFDEKEESSVMYCVYENGHWVMDSINYYGTVGNRMDDESSVDYKESGLPTKNPDITNSTSNFNFKDKSLKVVSSCIPGSDIPYNYIEQITVNIPNTEYALTLHNVSAEAAMYYNEDNIPVYRFSLMEPDSYIATKEICARHGILEKSSRTSWNYGDLALTEGRYYNDVVTQNIERVEFLEIKVIDKELQDAESIAKKKEMEETESAPSRSGLVINGSGSSVTGYEGVIALIEIIIGKGGWSYSRVEYDDNDIPHTINYNVPYNLLYSAPNNNDNLKILDTSSLKAD